MVKISGCIVTYNTDQEQLLAAMDSFLNYCPKDSTLYIVDNSPADSLKIIAARENVEYIHLGSNPGFGAAHNLAIQRSIKSGNKYHFIINPDIHFNTDVINPMVRYMQANQDVGMMMPEVLYPDGSIQYLPKLLPAPFWIIRRKFKKFDAAFDSFINKYELRTFPRKQIYNAPILSGCFTLLNLTAIQEVGGYDDKFFMYFEDFDLSRRVHEKYKTIYFPDVSVYHGYEGGANKSFKLFKIFLLSAFHYFNKWGWFNDRSRKWINDRALSQRP